MQAYTYLRRGLVALLLGLALPLAVSPALAQPQPPAEDAAPGPPAAWDVVGAPSAAMPLAEAAAAPGDCLGARERAIRYTMDGVIHLEGCGQRFTLSDLPAAGIGADKLELADAANQIWLLKTKLKVEEGATLRLSGGAGGDVRWLRLLSTPSVGIWLRAENGTLLIENTKITSWDPARNGPDTDPSVAADGSGGRSYIAVRSLLTKGRATAAPTACGVNNGSQEPYEGRMDITGSELAYLGYYAGESYGVVWKVYYKADPADPNDTPPPGRQLYALADVFGTITASSFHHNYFGSYTFGGYCMRWDGNTFANNLMYGLDPHDDSDYLTIEHNVFRDNGDHGVICSVECDHLVIRENQSFGNQHGIMIHRNVNGALIENNASHDNRGAGIAIFDSHDAVVRGNNVANNGESAVRLSVGASRNLIEGNTLAGPPSAANGPGYVFYTYKGSDAPSAGDGLPKANIVRNNIMSGYTHPLMKIGEASGNLFAGNTIAGPANQLWFSQAPDNTVADSPFGQPLALALDAASSVTLRDSRGASWVLAPAGQPATLDSAGAALRISAASVSATTVPLTVRPPRGQVELAIASWGADSRAWSERSSSTSGVVPHTVGGLTAGGCYSLAANGTPLGSFKADSAGWVGFSYAGGYANTVAFTLARAAQCDAAAPARVLFLPVARR